MFTYQTYTDLQLIDLLKQGDVTSFKAIYDRYWKLVFSLAHAKLDSFQDAEEIVQEIFAGLWERRATVQINRSVKYYLAAAVKYQVLTAFAKKNQRQQLENGLRIINEGYSTPVSGFIEFTQLQQELENIVLALPERCQLIYRLSREENFSNKEIAAELGISEKTVEAQMTRALSRIRKRIGDAAFILLFSQII